MIPTTLSLSLILLAAAPPAENPLAATDPWAGRWEGDGVGLVLSPAPEGGWRGELTFRGQSYPVSVRGDRERLAGTFRVGAAEYALEATPDGADGLRLASGGSTYRLRRIAKGGASGKATPGGGEARPGAPDDGKSAPPAGKVLAPLTDGTEYRHPVGFSFRHPKGWRVEPIPGALLLSPPDAKSDARGPREIYSAGGQKAPGAKAANDPTIATYLDEVAREISPTLRRSGPPRKVRTPGREAYVYDWKGTSPDGRAIRAVAWVTLIDGYGVTLVGLGETELVTRRLPVLERVFASFGFGRGERDERLAGVWYWERAITTGDFISSTKQTLVLKRDGTFRKTARFLAVDHTGYDVDTGPDGPKPKPGETGRWASRGSMLWLIYDDGSAAEYSFHVQGERGSRDMLLRQGSDRELWQERLP